MNPECQFWWNWWVSFAVALGTLLTVVVAGLAGCTKRQSTPTIGIDGWWGVDYVKNACQHVAAFGAVPCIRDGPTMVKQLEVDLLSAFQTNSECSGVSIVNDFHDPATDSASSKFSSAEWALSFSISIQDGGPNQMGSTWEMIDQRTHQRYARGDLGNLNQTATKICKVVKSKGGKVF